jgi:Fe-S-cluster containining protein
MINADRFIIAIQCPSSNGIHGGIFTTMTEPELVPLALDDTFEFACHSDVPCFNHCCRDLSQALTPYDVLRLKKNLGLTTLSFMERYAAIHVGPTTGLPVAALRFSPGRGRRCPFVTAEGCSVYVDRPASCRIYPLVRVLRRSRSDGSLVQQFALLHEPHCHGFKQKQRRTVRQWIDSQLLDAYHAANDKLLELIAMKNQLRPGPLSQQHQQLVKMACYDLETLKQQAVDGQLEGMDSLHLNPFPEMRDDEAWLRWSMAYLCNLLFGLR